MQSYPHEFSGGMSQRVMIAMAIALEPDLLIADEPTTALDVTVQAQIMQLLAELREQTGMALILITHDLGVVAESVARVLVMYAGRIVERGPTAEVIARPAHPYTAGLMSSVPRAEHKDRRLATIEGAPPVLTAIPPGCAFHPRCARSPPGLHERAAGARAGRARPRERLPFRRGGLRWLNRGAPGGRSRSGSRSSRSRTSSSTTRCGAAPSSGGAVGSSGPSTG